MPALLAKEKPILDINDINCSESTCGDPSPGVRSAIMAQRSILRQWTGPEDRLRAGYLHGSGERVKLLSLKCRHLGISV